MPSFTAQICLEDLAHAEALGEALESLNPEPTGVDICELPGQAACWQVTAYFVEPPDEIGLALLTKARKTGGFVIAELPETDWIAHIKHSLAPVRAGRFFLHGQHDADNIPQGVIALEIEAAMAFGTGHHATTTGCLQALDDLATAGFIAQNIADIGCGTAVLAMAAARLWPANIIAGDIDSVATETARGNITLNELEGRIDLSTCAGFEGAAMVASAPFDLIFANILKGPLLELAPEMGRFCAPDGRIILSGILVRQSSEIIAAYHAEGFRLCHQLDIDEWSTLTLKME